MNRIILIAVIMGLVCACGRSAQDIRERQIAAIKESVTLSTQEKISQIARLLATVVEDKVEIANGKITYSLTIRFDHDDKTVVLQGQDPRQTDKSVSMLMLAFELKRISQHLTDYPIESLFCTLQLVTSDVGWVDIFQVRLDRSQLLALSKFSMGPKEIRDPKNALQGRWSVIKDDFGKIEYYKPK